MVEVPDSTTRYIQSDSGKPTKDLFNWMRNISSQLASIFSGTGGGLFSSGLPCFSANKGGTPQGGFPYNAITQITFTNEVYDVGGYYSTSTSLWTPIAGKVFMTAASFSVPDGGGAPAGCLIYVYKNGVQFAQSLGSAFFGVNGATISVEDIANGTDTYGIRKIDIQSIVGGTSTISAGTATYFMGHWISP